MVVLSYLALNAVVRLLGAGGGKEYLLPLWSPIPKYMCYNKHWDSSKSLEEKKLHSQKSCFVGIESKNISWQPWNSNECRNQFISILLTRPGEPEPVWAGCFWLLGAGAAWKKTRSWKLYFCYSSLGKIVSFMVK